MRLDDLRASLNDIADHDAHAGSDTEVFCEDPSGTRVGIRSVLPVVVYDDSTGADVLSVIILLRSSL